MFLKNYPRDLIYVDALNATSKLNFVVQELSNVTTSYQINGSHCVDEDTAFGE